MSVIDPRELNDLAALASRGGLGRGVALTDCVAEQPDQLMYLSGDSLILLRDLGSILIASCEGVVGWVNKEHVHFDRIASASTPPSPKSSTSSIEPHEDLPRTVVHSPSPPLSHRRLPSVQEHIEPGKKLSAEPKEEDRRASNPFELDSPLGTPGIESAEKNFEVPIKETPNRESIMSDDSVNSSSFGGIAGFMMGSPSPPTSEHGGLNNLGRESSPGISELNGKSSFDISDVDSPITPGASADVSQNIIITSPSIPTDLDSPTSIKSQRTQNESWDIYDNYSRESMYQKDDSLVVERGRKETPSFQSAISRSSSNSPDGSMYRNSMMSNSSWDEEGRGFEAARLALQRVGVGRNWADDNDEEGQGGRGGGAETSLRMEEEGESRTSLDVPSEESHTAAPARPARRRPVATDLNPIPDAQDPITPKAAPRMSSESLDKPTTPRRVLSMELKRNGSINDPITPISVDIRRDEDTPKRLRIANPDSDDEDEPERQSSDGTHSASVTSTAVVTPNPPSEGVFEVSPTKRGLSLSPEPERIIISQPLLDSPPGLDDSPRKIHETPSQPSLSGLSTSDSVQSVTLRTPSTTPGPPRRPSFTVTSPDQSMRPPTTPWQSTSPSSPHSIDATRQAVEAVRKTPDAKRARGMTLVGRMEADLGASKGPVPITFVVGDSSLITTSPLIPQSFPMKPSTSGGSLRKSPSEQSTLASPLMDIDDPMRAMKMAPSAYPSMRSVTNPLPPSEPSVGGMPKPGFFPRPRSRSFSAAVNKVMTKKEGPGLTIQTDVPALPSAVSAGSAKRPFFSRQGSMPAPPRQASMPIPQPPSPAISLSPDIIGFIHANESATSLAPPSARSSSFSFRGRGSKTSLNPAHAPVSNKDYEDTVKADGLDFEIIQPKSKRDLLSPSTSSEDNTAEGADLVRKVTVMSAVSGTSGKSMRTLPDTDEWGFVKERSPTPEVFMGRAGGAGQRALEQKWLAIINSPIGSGPSKKVRKMAIEHGIPASLRGRVYAWFMTPIMSARRPGLYQELLDHDRNDSRLAEKIDSDVESAYPDHSIYSETSTGQTDLRSILRAYSHFATGGYRSEMSLIAGMLLIHCVAEDAFWLLSGFVNGSLKQYYASPTKQSGGKAVGMKVDSAVFAAVLAGSEPKLGKLFKDIGLHPIVFLEEWYAKLFLRCLPWPTALRIIDAVVAEGPRFLLIASLTILTLSRDRLLALPRNYTDVLGYLKDLPQDALLLPEGFMKACENVKFKEDDMKRLRGGVEKDLGLVVA